MTSRRLARASATIVVVVLAALLAAPGFAAAAVPQKLTQQLTDPGHVLGDSTAEVQAALDDLRTKKDVDLYVVLVPSFDHGGTPDWAERTAQVSGLRSSQVVFAVAVDSGQYEWWVDDASSLDATSLQSFITRSVEPRLAANEWAAGLSSLVTGLEQTRRVQPDAVAQAAGGHRLIPL